MKVEHTYCKTKRKAMFVLLEDVIFLVEGGTIVVPRGYKFDGATVPRFLWSIYSPTGVAFRASCLHDWDYDTKGLGMPSLSLPYVPVDRAGADERFRALIRHDGGPKFQAWSMWSGVRTPIGLRYWRDDSYPYYLLTDRFGEAKNEGLLKDVAAHLNAHQV